MPTRLVVGYEKELMAVHPDTLPMWQFLRYEPPHSPKSIRYTLCAAKDDLTMAGRYMHELSGIYDMCGLGAMTPCSSQWRYSFEESV